jgi:dTDP-4-amino-4,6-dideoxygalactose transaminase
MRSGRSLTLAWSSWVAQPDVLAAFAAWRKTPLPVAERAGEDVLSLPLSPAHSEEDIADVVEAFRRVHDRFTA